jgi:hypothetical protein
MDEDGVVLKVDLTPRQVHHFGKAGSCMQQSQEKVCIVRPLLVFDGVPTSIGPTGIDGMK